MSKPIFIATIPIHNLPPEEIGGYMDQISESLTLEDYHCLFCPVRSDIPTFQVFYEKDFNEVKFEELKQIVKDTILKLNEGILKS